MVHGDFKVGELCRTSGLYLCRTCQARRRESTVRGQAGKPSPECAVCKERGGHEVDTVWKLAAQS